MLSMTPLLLLVKTPMRQHKIEKNQWWWNMMNYVWDQWSLISVFWSFLGYSATQRKVSVTKNQSKYSDFSTYLCRLVLLLGCIIVSIFKKDMRVHWMSGWLAGSLLQRSLFCFFLRILDY
jgi:hypothetical protein